MDRLTPEQRRRCMQANRSKDTGLEKQVRSALHNRGLRFRKHCKNLPGTPDVVFPKEHIAIFIDGDFWHGYRFPKWRHKLNKYWQSKIERNRLRDKRNFAKLRRRGWYVVRIWEHQIESRLGEVVLHVAAKVRERRC